MTKRWSSTVSDLTKTKRQASKDARRYSKEMVEQLKKADAEPPEATVNNIDDLMSYLDTDT